MIKGILALIAEIILVTFGYFASNRKDKDD